VLWKQLSSPDTSNEDLPPQLLRTYINAVAQLVGGRAERGVDCGIADTFLSLEHVGTGTGNVHPSQARNPPHRERNPSQASLSTPHKSAESREVQYCSLRVSALASPLQYENYTLVVVLFIISCLLSGAALALHPCLAITICAFSSLGGAAR
jgi:hypothetical protein